MHQNFTGVLKAIQNNQVSCVAFDLDGTLYKSTAGIEQQLRPLMVKHAAATLGVASDEAASILRKYRSMYKSSILGLQRHHGVDPVSFYNSVYDSLDTTAMQRRPGLAEGLSGLAVHLPLYLFTNSNRSFTDKAMTILGLEGVFCKTITVEDHGFIRKPEREAYEMLYGDLDVAPSDVLMFDDIASSLMVMGGLGSRTVLVGNGLRPYPQFVDLHTGIDHKRIPPSVEAATHDIARFIADLAKAL